jgi:hypothetical protein
MRHAFSFPIEIRQAVKDHVSLAVRTVSGARFKQEPTYVAALMGRLIGVVYDGPEGFVELKPMVVDSIAPGAAENWSGADFAITAEIRNPRFFVSKAILAQAKLGALDDLAKSERGRLIEQIGKMRKFTRAPKTMLIRELDGRYEPEIASGLRIASGLDTKPLGLGDYLVRRVLTTLDGDTRPQFVAAVQESSLSQLRVLARL